jgi:hypothetical protein
MGVLAVYGFVQARLADERANIAIARLLTAKSQTELLVNHDRRLSLLFAMEAINASKNIPDHQEPAIQQAFRDAISQTGGDVLVSPDGNVDYVQSGTEIVGFQNILMRGLEFQSVLMPAGIVLVYAAVFFGMAIWRFRFE